MTTGTAVCMMALTKSRPETVDILGGTLSMIRSWIANSVQPEYSFRVDVPPMPMEDRIHMYDRQPVTTKAEITRILENVVVKIASRLMLRPTENWIMVYYDGSNTTTKMNYYTAMKAWITKLAFGFVINIVLKFWGDDLEDWPSLTLYDKDDLDWPSVLELEMDSPGDAANHCREGIEFAEYVRFDYEKVLAGTTVEILLYDLLLKEAMS